MLSHVASQDQVELLAEDAQDEVPLFTGAEFGSAANEPLLERCAQFAHGSLGGSPFPAQPSHYGTPLAVNHPRHRRRGNDRRRSSEADPRYLLSA
jgi:hypothetical protein